MRMKRTNDRLQALRGETLLERQSGANYFGRGNDSMGPLIHPLTQQTFDSYADYKDALRQESDGLTDARYDEYEQTRLRGSVSAELDLLGGLLRPLVGLQMAYYWIQDYTGEEVDAKDEAGEEVQAMQRTTRLEEDCAAGRVKGCDNGYDNFIKLGLSFDTRDFEPDPDHGVLAQLVGEISPGFLGSAETYFRLTTSLSGYYSLIPSITRLVAAGRILYSMSFGDVPFYSQDIYALSVEDRFGMGGFQTLRGYQQNRFVGRVGTVVNLELRWTFAGAELLNQHLRFGLTPFFEAGRVFDYVDDFSFDDWQWSSGLGFKLAWNMSTVISFDFGVSKENTGFFMMFGHQF